MHLLSAERAEGKRCELGDIRGSHLTSGRELRLELLRCGADFVHFVDISELSEGQNRGYPSAVLLGMILSRSYLEEVRSTPEYVRDMLRNNRVDSDEFHLKEIRTDRLANGAAEYLEVNGYSACSQSEESLISSGLYNEQTRTTPLPHKTIALLAGIGWIGKNNLLVTPESGSAVSLCTVLTNAPLTTILHTPVKSQCGDCSICLEVCLPGALKGREWNVDTSRDEMLDHARCTTCLKCLAFCPWTERYVKKNIN